MPPQLRANLKTVQLWQHYIQQNERGLFFTRSLQPAPPVERNNHAIPFSFQRILQRYPHRRFIFDEQYSFSLLSPVHALNFSFRLSGNSIVNLLPCPTALRTSTRPPCASTICFTMVNPIPIPCVSRLSSEPRR